MPRRPIRKREGGQSLVEFALVVPMLLILVFGVVDFGLGLRAYISIASATREGARFAVVGNAPGTFVSGNCSATPTTAIDKVCRTIDGLNLTNVQNVKVETCNNASPRVCSTATLANMQPGEAVRVTANYRYHYITPVKALINFVSAGTIADYFTINSATEMRIE